LLIEKESERVPNILYLGSFHIPVLSPSYRAFVSSLSSISIPQGWKEAITIPEWKESMVEEMTALKKNGT
jgi:hypothetical protein